MSVHFFAWHKNWQRLRSVHSCCDMFLTTYNAMMNELKTTPSQYFSEIWATKISEPRKSAREISWKYFASFTFTALVDELAVGEFIFKAWNTISSLSQRLKDGFVLINYSKVKLIFVFFFLISFCLFPKQSRKFFILCWNLNGNKLHNEMHFDKPTCALCIFWTNWWISFSF